MRPALALLGLLAACSASPRPVPVVAHAPPAAIPVATPLTLNPVRWHVLSPVDLKALLARKPVTVFALDAANYQNLALNFIEIKRYLGEQKAIIALLKKIGEQQAGVVTTSP